MPMPQGGAATTRYIGMACRTLLAASVVAALLALAPAAAAQDLPSAPDVGDATGGVTTSIDNTTSDLTDTVDETTGEITDSVGDTTGGVTDTVDGTANDVGGTVGGATDVVGGGSGGSGGSGGGGDPVDDLTDTVNGTIDDTTGLLDGDKEGEGGGSGGSGGGSLPNTTDVVNSLLGGNSTALGASLDNLLPSSVDDIVDHGAGLGLSPAAAEGWIDGKKVLGTSAFKNPAFVLAAMTDILSDFATGAVDGISLTSTTQVAAFETRGSGSSFFEAAGRAAATAAKALAFPLALALLVVGFLAIQGRFGRKDPKLVLAPIDAAEDSLTFE